MKMEVNIGRLEEIIGDDAEMKKTLLGMFVNSCEKNIVAIQNAINSNDSNLQNIWKDSVHDIKGSAYNLGFEELGEYCLEVENKQFSLDEKQQVIAAFIDAKNGVSELLKNL